MNFDKYQSDYEKAEILANYLICLQLQEELNEDEDFNQTEVDELLIKFDKLLSEYETDDKAEIYTLLDELLFKTEELFLLKGFHAGLALVEKLLAKMDELKNTMKEKNETL